MYLREAMLWNLQRPAAARRNATRESWHELRVFDPSQVAVPSAPELLDEIESPAALITGIESPPERHARAAA